MGLGSMTASPSLANVEALPRLLPAWIEEGLPDADHVRHLWSFQLRVSEVERVYVSFLGLLRPGGILQLDPRRCSPTIQ